MIQHVYDLGVNLIDRLQWIFDNQSITQRELSRRAGMNPGQLSATFKRLREHPNAGIEHDTAVAIANAAHVNVEWLRFGTGERESKPTTRTTEIERALFVAAQQLRVDLDDFEAARAALKDSSFLLSGDLAEFARDWLIAAQQLRKDGHPVNAGTIGVRAALNAANRLSREVKEIREEVGATSGIRPAFDDEGQPVTQAKSK